MFKYIHIYVYIYMYIQREIFTLNLIETLKPLVYRAKHTNNTKVHLRRSICHFCIACFYGTTNILFIVTIFIVLGSIAGIIHTFQLSPCGQTSPLMSTKASLGSTIQISYIAQRHASSQCTATCISALDAYVLNVITLMCLMSHI